MPTPPPTLLVATVFFSPGDRDPARSLGFALYDHLTRPLSDRLAFGAGIPVMVGARFDALQLDSARRLLLIPVLGADAFRDEETRAAALERIEAWRDQLGPESVCPVLRSDLWRAEARRLANPPCLARPRAAEEDPAGQQTLFDATLAACRLLRGSDMRLRIFVSHARRELPETLQLAARLQAFAARHPSAACFETVSLEPGHDLNAQLQEAKGCGVFVALRSDSFGARIWCQREILWAKQAQLPVLTVEVLGRGERRSYPYAGNSPTLVWPGDEPAAIVLRAFIEWLRARHFQLEAERWLPNMPPAVVLHRPPELLDLAQGPLLDRRPTLVLYPDPEVSAVERQLLREARPRMRLLTPGTIYRCLLHRHDLSNAPRRPSDCLPADAEFRTAPLHGHRIALSLSNSPESLHGDEGFTREHVDDAVTQLARALIAGGGAIAYGGDFRSGGFDELLSQLIVAYNESGIDRAKYLYSFLPATRPAESVPDDLPVTICSLARTRAFAAQAILPPPGPPPHSPALHALHVSDMRRVMTASCFARVILGGQSRPRANHDPQGEGYMGRYPGVVEEAWRALEISLPLYVAGGFGGAAGLVADLLDGRPTPPELRDSSFSGPEFSEFRSRVREFQDHPGFRLLRLPPSLEALADVIRASALALLASDATAQAWNGLTVAENRALFRARDPVLITQLVMKGLFAKAAQASRGNLRIELVRGDIAKVEAADALAFAAFRDAPLATAGANLDETLSRAVSHALRSGNPLLEIPNPEIDADWLLVADLGRLGNPSDAPAVIERGARRVAELTLRHGFHRVGITTFGGPVLTPRLPAVVEAMIEGLKPAANLASFHWHEPDAALHEKLRALLSGRPGVSLSTRVLSARAAEPSSHAGHPRDLLITVRYENEVLHATVLPPAGSVAAIARSTPLTREAFRALAASDAPGAPALADLDRAGDRLAELLLGPDAKELLASEPLGRIVIQHDLESASLPYETLRAGTARCSLREGLVRRPAIAELPAANLRRRPAHVGNLNIVVVDDPTGDLPGAKTEAERMLAVLQSRPGVTVLKRLSGAAATRDAVLAALSDPRVDVLHYSGHAFFHNQGPGGSGLLCAGQDPLTVDDLIGLNVLPRMVFLNACQSARVRRERVSRVSGAFAESILRGPVEAYIGSFWPVADEAAAEFAAGLYLDLATGERLDSAVRRARVRLLDAGEPDWANYALYGDGAFRFLVS